MFVLPRRVPQHHPYQQDQQLLPSTFQLCTPPPGRRSRRSLVLTSSRGDAPGPGTGTQQSQAELRAEAVSKLKLLLMPSQAQEQVCAMLYNTLFEYASPSCSQRVKLTYFHICFHTDGPPFQLWEEYTVHTLQ